MTCAHKCFVIGIAFLLSCALCRATDYPTWWTSRNVINTNAGVTNNDYAAVNQGQVKWIATNACDELEEYLPCGAGTSLLSVVAAFSDTNNYLAVNHGQLKSLAALFYDRLIYGSYTNAYPWSSTTADDCSYAAANIGQVKFLFSFDLSKDNDTDTLPDWWENAYFKTTAYDGSDDFDNDGMVNSNEWLYGINPALTDSDGDGMGDGTEDLYGYSPSTSNSYTLLPFIELFETNTVNQGDISNQNGWVASPAGAAIVQTNTVYTGDQALALQATANIATASHIIGAADRDFVWSEFCAQPAQNDTDPDISDTAASAFYVNTNGQIVVYDGLLESNNWAILTNHPAIATSTWVKLTVRQNFDNQHWDLWLNETNVALDLGFANPVVEYSQARFTGDDEQDSYIDDLTISSSYPALEHTISGTISYSGGRTGQIRIVAVTVSNSWSDFLSSDLSSPGAYSISNVPGMEHYWVKAYIDTDADERFDPLETSGIYAADPFFVIGNTSQVNVTLIDPDDDGDGIGDWWEIYWFGGTNNCDPAEDPDDDDFLNIYEYTCLTDPQDSGSYPPPTYYVATWGKTSGTGSYTAPFRTIQAALDAATDDYDVILVENGTYTGTGNKNLDYGGRKVMVVSRNGSDAATIDCKGSGRGFYFHSGETAVSVLKGFSIVNGTNICGGGLYCSASPTILSCDIAGNSAGQWGGGMYVHGSAPLIRECTFSGNIGSHGGALALSNSTCAVVERCFFTGNSASGHGGAVYLNDSTPTIDNCTIYENAAALDGGGMLCCSNSDALIRNCTVTDNSAGSAGGGVACDSAGPNLRNSILWDNTPDQISGAGPIVQYCDVEGGYAGTGNINTNPLLTAAFRLRIASPCIDAGCTNAPDLDRDGEERWDDPAHSNVVCTVDIGSDEYVDTDADNMADYWEIAHFGSIANQAGTGDFDGDQLLNSSEYDQSLDPADSDCDDDGLPDGIDAYPSCYDTNALIFTITYPTNNMVIP